MFIFDIPKIGQNIFFDLSKFLNLSLFNLLENFKKKNKGVFDCLIFKSK